MIKNKSRKSLGSTIATIDAAALSVSADQTVLIKITKNRNPVKSPINKAEVKEPATPKFTLGKKKVKRSTSALRPKIAFGTANTSTTLLRPKTAKKKKTGKLIKSKQMGSTKSLQPSIRSR